MNKEEIIHEYLSKNGKKGARSYMKNSTPEQRKKRAMDAGLANKERILKLKQQNEKNSIEERNKNS